jgi:hypothetical protein
VANRAKQAHLEELPSIKQQVHIMAADPTVLPEIRDHKKRAFVLGLAAVGTKLRAAEIAGVNPSTPYTAQWRNDLVLQAAVKEAEEAAADRIEAEAYRRGVEGVVEPVGWYQGKPGAYVRKYSDVMAIFLLKGLRPEKYQERVQMRGALANLDMNLLPDEAIDRIANGEPVMAVLASMVPRAGEQVPGLIAPPEEEPN